MNIFFLATDPETCARFYCDKHVIKIILEICQMLWTAWHESGEIPLPPDHITIYKATHKNHPMSVWVRSSPSNYKFAAKLAKCLCKEKRQRYPDRPAHKCEPIIDWLSKNIPNLSGSNSECKESENSSKSNLKRKWHRELHRELHREWCGTTFATRNNPDGTTPVPLCMPSEYHSEDLIESYRTYYNNEKSDIATWKTQPPTWFRKCKKIKSCPK